MTARLAVLVLIVLFAAVPGAGSLPAWAETADAEAPAEPEAKPELSRVTICSLIDAAADRHDLPVEYFTRLIWKESRFRQDALSPKGAQGIAQFMPGTARGMGLDDPFDPHAAIDAQAHLMRDLLRQFGAVPLALAAYNAGPAPVAACGCVPPYPETRGYVARILGLMSGAGEPVAPGPAGGLAVRLVE